MHLCPGNWVDIGRVLVYYAPAAHSFSAGITCRHCRYWVNHSAPQVAPLIERFVPDQQEPASRNDLNP